MRNSFHQKHRLRRSRVIDCRWQTRRSADFEQQLLRTILNRHVKLHNDNVQGCGVVNNFAFIFTQHRRVSLNCLGRTCRFSRELSQYTAVNYPRLAKTATHRLMSYLKIFKLCEHKFKVQRYTEKGAIFDGYLYGVTNTSLLSEA